jgi:hypothetical protein
MNLKRIISRYSYLLLLAALSEVRAIWEYFLSPDFRVYLVTSSIGLALLLLPFPLEVLSVWLERYLERKKIAGSVFVAIFASAVAIGFWREHSSAWAVLNLLLGLFLLLALWKDRLFPEREGRRQARRAKAEKLFADRDAFEKSWERRIKITEGIILLFCALLAGLFWTTSFKLLAILPALFALLFLIGLFATLTPLSDEKFEGQLAKAKARFERAETRRAFYAARRAGRAERMEERKRRPKPSDRSAESLSSFVYWSLMLGVLGFQDRSRLEKPDLVFCAMPLWYLIRAAYFHMRQSRPPQGPDAPLTSDSSTATQ